MPFDNLNIADIQRKIHYNDEVVGQLFARYLGMNPNDPIGKIIWTDARTQHEFQGTITPNSEQAPDIQWTDEEVDRITQATPLNQTINYTDNQVSRITQVTPLQQQLIYTDEQTQNQFQGSQQRLPESGKVTDEVAISRFENSGVASNTYNYAKPKGTNFIQSVDYYNDLLQRKLVNNSGGQKLALFLGMYEVLLMLNPRFNYIVNPAVVPSWLPPEGIAPVTLDAIIYDYSRNLLATDVPGIKSSSDAAVKDAADAGYALGQIAGSDFTRATSPVNKILNLIPNLLRGALGDGNTNDPNIASLEKRLSNFNKLQSDGTETPRISRNDYTKKYEPYQTVTFSPKGDAVATPGILPAPVSKLDKVRNDDDANYHIKSNYNLENMYDDFGTKNAENSWLTFNIKPNSKTFDSGTLDDALNMAAPISTSNFNELVVRELSQFVKTSVIPSTTANTNSTTGDSNSNSFSNILTTGPAADVIKKIYDDMQFPFFFEEVTDQNPTWCGFPATIKLQTDTISPAFNDTPVFVGRPEQATIYSNTKRSIQMEFQLYVEHPKFLSAYKQRINWLVQRCYPKFYDSAPDSGPKITIYKSPPLIRMTIGDIYYRLGGYISSLTLNWSSASDIWEKHLVGNRIPLTCNINLSFNVLHDFIPDATSKFFSWKSE